MILSDSAIKERIAKKELEINSPDNKDSISNLWPASLDFRLWNIFKVYKKNSNTCIDARAWVSDEDVKTYELPENEPFVVHPWDFVLWVTMEKIKIPYDLVARCEWRSSIWRLWIIIHSTAWFIDPGFEWTITLEITNINELPVALYPWMRIGQFAFEKVLWEVENPYDKRIWSKYMNQEAPEQSRICQDLENKNRT